VSSENLKLVAWVFLFGGIFGYFWWKGYLLKIKNYVSETKDELRKCTWPSWEELKGSTVVVFITTAMIGIFTVCVDVIISWIIRGIT